ncbi:type I restriction endonuclease [Bdellovibrio svalbardensis]|uniref:Type I restriction enzyme HsdR N-terminal domain-containing protein n=1 Tax=Bdellovibrio svalbardensis TaxID=2972972 RepID=A0ABT6DI82_9BACT|nr:type I restriction endonuclease [Bdellovibrio svalbardensis]MDG0815945.1 type I restriction enzyme HsdR N-terminal domain-containing protein [Bdellovibrio svalbardensis]
MARETKQDRTVRAILDQTIEHLHELKTLDASVSSKELDVERWAQSFLRNCLGYTASAGYTIRAQETKGKTRPDLIVLHKDKPVFVVEVKKIGFDLSKSDFRSGKTQLAEYLNQIGNVRWGMLTNGVEWKLFDFSQTQYGGIEISAFDLKSDGDMINVTKKSVEEQCYEFFDFHESSFTESSWPELSKEAMAFSPESLSKAILSVDVVRYIAKFVRGEHEFKANHEILTDRLYWLLEQGLNDAIAGWNETKAAEIHKYVKAQKRASRKTKKSKRDASTTECLMTEAIANTSNNTDSNKAAS